MSEGLHYRLRDRSQRLWVTEQDLLDNLLFREAADCIEELVKERDEYKTVAAIWQEDFIQENQRLYVATVKLAIAIAALRNILSGDDLYPWRIAREVLAELEGK